MLKARTVEAEKQPLLGNSRTQRIEEMSLYVTSTAVAMDRLGKRVRGDVSQQ
jgi:hypothetical protein